MRKVHAAPSSACRVAASSLLIAVLATALFLPRLVAKKIDAPLILARTGWMYVGGRVITIDGKQYTVGQMYAEYLIPAAKLHPYPVIMVHGGTMSGPTWIKLGDHGIHGNSHVMMMEKNSEQIAELLISWANQAIPSKNGSESAAH